MTTSNLQPTTYNSPWIPISLAVLIFASLSIICAVTSTGFLEADGCTHYMYARWAFEYPVYFVDIWGRPIKTLLYAPAAATFGVIGVRLTSLAIAISIAFVAYAIAKGQHYRWPALAVIFTFAQPLVFLHSFSELTELPFALLLGLAFLFYQRKKFWLLALFAGLLPLSRPEGFGFVVLVACLLAFHRKWIAIPLVALPVIGWQIAGAILYHEPQNWWNWLPKHWPYAGDSLYAAGPIWHFAALLPAAVGPIVFPFVLLGFLSPFRYSERGPGGRASSELRDEASCHPECTHEGPTQLPKPARSFASTLRMTIASSHAFRCDALIAAIPLMIFVGHSVLYAMGKMASNGELRYMLIVAPFWALLATRGWSLLSPSPGTPACGELAESGEGRGEGSLGAPETDDLPVASPAFPEPRRRWFLNPYLLAGVAAIAPVFANFGYKVLPLVQTEDWQTAARIAEWYKTSGVAEDYPNVMASHPGVLFHLDRAPLDPRVVEWRRKFVDQPKPGTLIIWDHTYGVYNADASRSVHINHIDVSAKFVASDLRYNRLRYRTPEWSVARSMEPAPGRAKVRIWKPLADPSYWPPPLRD